MESPQRRSKIEKVRLDLLRVPAAGKAQRPFKRAKGDHIAANFDIDSFGFPVVCRVDGVHWLVDGQHRVYAIQECGYAAPGDDVECEVYEGLSLEDMARMFLGRNRSTPVTGFERFTVAVTAGYGVETAIVALLSGLGLKLGYPKTRGNVYAVGALRRVCDRDGPKILGRVLRVSPRRVPFDPASLRSPPHRRRRLGPVDVLGGRGQASRLRPRVRGPWRARSPPPRRGLPRAPRPAGSAVRRCGRRRYLQQPVGQEARLAEVVEGAAAGSPPACPAEPLRLRSAVRHFGLWPAPVHPRVSGAVTLWNRRHVGPFGSSPPRRVRTQQNELPTAANRVSGLDACFRWRIWASRRTSRSASGPASVPADSP